MAEDPKVVMAAIPALEEDPDPGRGNSAGTDRPVAVSRNPAYATPCGKNDSPYDTHSSTPPELHGCAPQVTLFDPFRETHDARMPRDEAE